MTCGNVASFFFRADIEKDKQKNGSKVNEMTYGESLEGYCKMMLSAPFLVMELMMRTAQLMGTYAWEVLSRKWNQLASDALIFVSFPSSTNLPSTNQVNFAVLEPFDLVTFGHLGESKKHQEGMLQLLPQHLTSVWKKLGGESYEVYGGLFGGLGYVEITNLLKETHEINTKMRNASDLTTWNLFDSTFTITLGSSKNLPIWKLEFSSAQVLPLSVQSRFIHR